VAPVTTPTSSQVMPFHHIPVLPLVHISINKPHQDIETKQPQRFLLQAHTINTKPSSINSPHLHIHLLTTPNPLLQLLLRPTSHQNFSCQLTPILNRRTIPIHIITHSGIQHDGITFGIGVIATTQDFTEGDCVFGGTTTAEIG